jgi:hypothetical protein
MNIKEKLRAHCEPVAGIPVPAAIPTLGDKPGKRCLPGG